MGKDNIGRFNPIWFGYGYQFGEQVYRYFPEVMMPDFIDQLDLQLYQYTLDMGTSICYVIGALHGYYASGGRIRFADGSDRGFRYENDTNNHD